MFEKLKSLLGGNDSRYTNLDGESFTRAVQQDPKAVILDVRSVMEYRMEHIAGAKNIDIMGSKFQEELSKLDKNLSYYVYCRSGLRSNSAVKQMAEMGFSKLYNLNGGLSHYRGRTQ